MPLTVSLLLALLLIAPPAYAQSEDSENEAPAAEENKVSIEDFEQDASLGFTGTLAEDDPDNEQFAKEQAIFNDDDVEGDEEDELETHLIKFQFASMVQFSELSSQEVKSETTLSPTAKEPFNEIEYITAFEKPFNLSPKRANLDIDADIDTQIWGSLAKNEFFNCRLEITMQQMSVNVVSRLKKEKPPEDDEEAEEKFTCALKIKFSKESREDWFSFCTDVTGATLNTKGNTEEHNLTSLSMIEPSLKTLLVEDCDPTDIVEVNLSVPPTQVDDYDVGQQILYSGEGSLSIEPL